MAKQIILLDQQPILLRGLKREIEDAGNYEVVATATNSDKGFFEIVERMPDLVIMDIELPGRGAFTIAEQIAARLPATRVAFFTDYLTDIHLDMALRLRVAGYLLKTEPVEELLRALPLMLRGERVYSEPVLKRLDDNNGEFEVRSHVYLGTLTLRQVQVLRHLVRGESVKEVAKAMVLSERAIESHKYRIMQKLGIHDRVELARYAIREGLMPA